MLGIAYRNLNDLKGIMKIIQLGKISEVSVEILDANLNRGLVVRLEFQGSPYSTTTFLCLEQLDDIDHLKCKMKAAKVTKLNDLKNKPIEITFYNNMLHSWRILTEVL